MRSVFLFVLSTTILSLILWNVFFLDWTLNAPPSFPFLSIFYRCGQWLVCVFNVCTFVEGDQCSPNLFEWDKIVLSSGKRKNHWIFYLIDSWNHTLDSNQFKNIYYSSERRIRCSFALRQRDNYRKIWK